MLKALALAGAVLILAAPGEAKPKSGKEEQGIKAEVRGTLGFEHGRGYFVSVKPADKADGQARVWLRVTEDKLLVRKLEGLQGKVVVARGRLAQMPADVQASVPPLGMYLHHGFEVEAAGRE